ncbi:TPA: class I SAM-dependent methyltransferase [bacterium]|nr:class I SAM-dependent methyltransferase [bacterium]
MNTESLLRSPIGKLFARILATAMESRFRYRFFGPTKILEGVGDLRDQTVLEVGCGTGFFTIPVARLIGDHGSLVAIDIIPESVEMVSKKVQSAKLQNVRVIKTDALNTNLDTASFETVLLFGVIPSPMVPLIPLLTELHRVLRPSGILAVWPPVPGWLPRSVQKSGLFTLINKRNNVYNFKRS